MWSEELPLDEVARPDLLAALHARDVDLLVAVRPWTLAGTPRLVAACREAGVRVGLWPMLGDAEGRWANAENVERFAGFACEVAERLSGEGLAPDEMVVDLEPPIWAVRRWVERLRPAPAVAARKLDAGERFRQLVEGLGGMGLSVTAAVVPLVLADEEADEGRAGWQRLLGTPVDGVGFERVEVMLYTSLLEGYSRGMITRAAACALLHALALRAKDRFGSRTSVALGAVSTGALGHEPVYRSVDELAHDVSIARAAGIDSLSLFDLAGVVRRPPVERWLDAFVETPAGLEPPRSSRRARAAWWLIRRAGAWARDRR